MAAVIRQCNGKHRNNVSERDKERVLNHFSTLVERHGDDVLSLDWGSRSGQHTRFEVLCGGTALEGKRVLDVGCGLGDMALWLEEQGIAVDYTGIDITPAMIDRVRARLPGKRFLECDLLEDGALEGERFDVVLSSGIFYLCTEGRFDFMTRMVTAMFDRADEMVAFNCLSAWGDRQDEGEFYVEPDELLRTCRPISRKIALRHDYHPADVSVFLYKEIGEGTV